MWYNILSLFVGWAEISIWIPHKSFILYMYQISRYSLKYAYLHEPLIDKSDKNLQSQYEICEINSHFQEYSFYWSGQEIAVRK